MLTGIGRSKQNAKKQAAHKMWEKLQDSSISSSSIMPALDDDEEVCAQSRTKFSLSAMLVTAVRCMPSMHMTFTVPVACSSCGAVRSRVLGFHLYVTNMSFPHLEL